MSILPLTSISVLLVFSKTEIDIVVDQGLYNYTDDLVNEQQTMFVNVRAFNVQNVNGGVIVQSDKAVVVEDYL